MSLLGHCQLKTSKPKPWNSGKSAVEASWMWEAVMEPSALCPSLWRWIWHLRILRFGAQISCSCKSRSVIGTYILPEHVWTVCQSLPVWCLFKFMFDVSSFRLQNSDTNQDRDGDVLEVTPVGNLQSLRAGAFDSLVLSLVLSFLPTPELRRATWMANEFCCLWIQMSTINICWPEDQPKEIYGSQLSNSIQILTDNYHLNSGLQEMLNRAHRCLRPNGSLFVIEKTSLGERQDFQAALEAAGFQCKKCLGYIALKNMNKKNALYIDSANVWIIWSIWGPHTILKFLDVKPWQLKNDQLRYSAVGTLDGDSRANSHAHAWHLCRSGVQKPSPLPSFKVGLDLGSYFSD